MEGDSAVLAAIMNMDISIHTLRMEGDSDYLHRLHPAPISIHTLRMEGDGAPGWRHQQRAPDFNPHPPHGG